MKRNLFLSFLLVGTTSLAQAADEGRLLRFPATNGSDVVFSYAGDLYKVSINGGESQRITSHPGYEMFARFSPDGKSIAFTGEYDGNREVYIIPAKGGEPVRLTYTSTNSRDDLGDRMGPNNVVMTWSPDGKKILYRNRISDGFAGKLWSISPSGGMSDKLPLPEGGFCSYSPDGKKLAYNRVFREFRTWKYYKGGMADDIWVYNPENKSVENVTNNIAQDIIPMWIGDEIFFISDRDRTMNLFSYNTVSKTTQKVTDFKEYDIKFPSSNGKIIVFENGGYIYKFDPTTRKAEKISITVNAEGNDARDILKNVKNNITEASTSPDAKRIAVTARGEVFNVPVSKGVTKDLTRSTGIHDREAEWSPDGKYIAYISDATGENEIYIQPAEGGEAIQLTKDNNTYIRQILWSPDSKSIAYSDMKNRILMVDVASKSKKTIIENPEGEFYEFSFSPDSRWITYTKSGKNNMDIVYVKDLTSGKEYPVTEKWYNSGNATFSTDGKYIIFSSERDLNPIYSRTEWNHAYTTMKGLYLVPLASTTPSPFLPKDGDVQQSVNIASKDSKGKSKDSKESVTTQIDPENMLQRIVKLPLPTGNYYNLYSDGKDLWYNVDGQTKVFNFESGKDEFIADNTSFKFTPDGKKIMLFKRGSIYVLNAPHGKVSLDEAVDLKDLVAPINYKKEWEQIFNEAWRAYRDGFYLENMHGADWKALKDKYAVMLPYVKCRLDLNYLIGELIGELACGHAYVNPGEYKKPDKIDMGLLGAELKADNSGFFKIEKIISGAPYSTSLRSPLTETGMNIKEGEYIVAINGVPTNSVSNIYSLLIGKADVLTELSVNSTPSLSGARKVVVKPINNEYPLYHYNWVQDNIKKVEKATNGRVGYVYIPDMGSDGLNEFTRYFYPQLDKEALIIDDRANGGGNVSPMIIERLLRDPYRMTMYRTTTKTGTIPDATLYGPKVLLINKYSASDGDLFPWSFKATKIGKVIGTRSWGGIIGISGSLPYMDGTDIRVPFFTNYDAKSGKWIVENHGVDPDILIDNNPIKEEMGEDEQLNKAIEVILDELKDRKPLPGVPAPRTYKDLGVE